MVNVRYQNDQTLGDIVDREAHLSVTHIKMIKSAPPKKLQIESRRRDDTRIGSF
jgi:hypothetical protein